MTTAECARCAGPLGKKWWQRVPRAGPSGEFGSGAPGDLCDPCHDTWLDERKVDDVKDNRSMLDETPRMDPEDYADRALVTARPAVTPGRFNLTCLTHAAIGCASEAGELLDAVKRAAFYGLPLDRTNVIEECGDLLWYVAYALRSVDGTFDEAMQANLRKLAKRYGGQFSAEKAATRDAAAERAALEGDK